MRHYFLWIALSLPLLAKTEYFRKMGYLLRLCEPQAKQSKFYLVFASRRRSNPISTSSLRAAGEAIQILSRLCEPQAKQSNFYLVFASRRRSNPELLK